MKFIKIAALSLLALSGNAVDGFLWFGDFPGVSKFCNRALDAVSDCVFRGPTDDFDFFMAGAKARECLNTAADDAAKKACLKPLFDIAAESCSGLTTWVKSYPCDLEISPDLEDAAALLEDKKEDKFIAVDELELNTKARAYKLRGRQ